MNKCYIKITGPAKEIIKFMVENFIFSEVYDNGIHFVTKIDFSKILLENDELFIKENYSVYPLIECSKMNVVAHSSKYEENYEDIMEEEYMNNIYEFKIEQHGQYFDIYKTFEKGVCYKETFVNHPKDFMSGFFNYFAHNNINSHDELTKLKSKMKQRISMSFEFNVYDMPINILDKWADEYKMYLTAEWASENEFLIYTRYEDVPKDENKSNIRVISANEKLEVYIEKVLMRGWADAHKMVVSICDMLYDMKDNFPVNIDLQLKPVPEDKPFSSNNRFVYNTTYGKITNVVYNLINSNVYALANLYTGLYNMHKQFLNK